MDIQNNMFPTMSEFISEMHRTDYYSTKRKGEELDKISIEDRYEVESLLMEYDLKIIDSDFKDGDYEIVATHKKDRNLKIIIKIHQYGTELVEYINNKLQNTYTVKTVYELGSILNNILPY